MPDLFRRSVSAVARVARHQSVGALTLSLAFALVSPFAGAHATEPVDLELVLAVDVSGSIDPTEAKLQREGYQRALTNPEVIQAISSGPLGKIALSYVEWAGMGHYKVVVDWQVVDGPEAANSFVEQLSRVEIERAHRTSLSDAITFSAKHLDSNDFEGTRRIVDISGDGANNFGRLVVEARDEAVAQGVIINGLPILTQSPTAGTYPSIPNLDLFFRDCVIGGPGAFYVTAHGFDDFARAVKKKLILEIAGMAPLRPQHAASPGPSRATFRLAQSGPAQQREAPPCNVGEWRWMSIIQGGTQDR